MLPLHVGDGLILYCVSIEVGLDGAGEIHDFRRGAKRRHHEAAADLEVHWGVPPLALRPERNKLDLFRPRGVLLAARALAVLAHHALRVVRGGLAQVAQVARDAEGELGAVSSGHEAQARIMVAAKKRVPFQ